MKWSLRRVYLYLVSLITFIMVLVGFWNLASNAVDLIWPSPVYWVCTPTEEGLPEKTQQCEEERQQEEERQRIYNLQGLAKSALFLVIVLPAYLYHWREANRTEGSAGNV